jgi:hypothetical protein
MGNLGNRPGRKKPGRCVPVQLQMEKAFSRKVMKNA